MPRSNFWLISPQCAASVLLASEPCVLTMTSNASTRARCCGNAVSRIDAAEEANKGTVKSLQDLLNGRAAGVVIQPATGAVAAAFAAVNIFGGFLVTQRMLAMYKKKSK